MARGARFAKWRWVGNLLICGGLLVVALPVGLAVYTNETTRRSQGEALTRWEQDRAHRAPSVRRTEKRREIVAEVPFVLEIPKIGLRWLIREGTDVDDLRRNGAGHIPGTSLPGQPGIVGVAGHRTTYGAPFFRLNELGPGDEVRIRSANAVFVYRAYYQTQVRPTQVEILEPKSSDPILVLISCSPPFSAEFRLAVFARLSHVADEPNTTAR